MYLQDLKKEYRGETYFPAEAFYGYIEEQENGKHIVDINPDIIESYKCHGCGCHTSYEEFLTKGYIDKEFTRENLYKCPVCGRVNLIPDYNAEDSRRENLISNDEIVHIHGGKKYREKSNVFEKEAEK